MIDWKLEEVVLGNGNRVTYKVHPSGMAFHKSLWLKSEARNDDRETPDDLCELLVKLRETGDLVRVFYGGEDGTSCLDECDIAGTVGRSCGRFKIPLLVPPDEIGGARILDQCIVRLDIQIEGEKSYHTVWQRKDFQLPQLSLETTELPLECPYSVSRYVKELNEFEPVARFLTTGDRDRWLHLVLGLRFPDALDFELWRS